MRNPAVPLALLVPLLLLSAASRLSATGEPGPTEKKKTVVIGPEKRIVVDGDRVIVWDDADPDVVAPEVIADLPDFDDQDFPRVVRFHGHRAGGYLGVRSIEMTPDLRQHFGAPRDAGVMVGSLEADGPAARAGIQVGDILTAVDGEQVGSTRELSRSVRRHKAGDAVKVDLLRDRAKKTLTVTVKEIEAKDHEMRIGEFGHWPHGFAWRDWDDAGPAIAPVPPVPPVPPVAPDGPRGSLQNRMDVLEQRMREIEGRLPPPAPR